ncbi:hypothetical protein ABT131_27850, partial [Streptomyces sp900105245]|uniref:hypothetical protein n=1 Tax=Streptomyces sp. 900105245 TaxID=3154379 RepID=UPI00333075DF
MAALKRACAEPGDSGGGTASTPGSCRCGDNRDRPVRGRAGVSRPLPFSIDAVPSLTTVRLPLAEAG